MHLLAAFLAGLFVAAVTTPAGISGAVLLLPVQVSLLGVPSPAVTPTGPSASSSVLPLQLGKPVWLIAASALSSLLRLDSDGTVTKRWFADDRTLVIAAPDASMPVGWTNRVLSLTSLDAIRRALAQGVLPDVAPCGRTPWDQLG